MSSILDALKKLESEKSNSNDPDERAHIESVAAERDLTRRRRRSQSDDEVIRINSTAMIVAGLAVATVLVTVSVVAALAIYRSLERPTLAAGPPSAPTGPEDLASSQPLAPAPLESAPFEPIVEYVEVPEVPAPVPLQPVASDPTLMEPATVPEPIEAAMPSPEPVVWVEPEPVQNAVPAVPDPAPLPDVAPEPEPAWTGAPAEPTPAPETATPPTPDYSEAPIGEVDLRTLPMLSESERFRLGLPPLKINIVGLPTKRQPRPSALINFEKVYLGEYIKNTNARLIAVELHGVGIEVAGHRYFMEK
jgi:hypothetical protein